MNHCVLTMMCLWLTSTMAVGQGAPERMGISPSPPSNAVELEHAMNNGPRGRIAVRAVQGTKGGPAIGSAEVEVELFHRNQGIKRIPARLDEHGVVMISDVPLGLSVRPVIRVKYANATYQDVGPQMDSQHPDASVDVTVYEITDERPNWRVLNRTLAIAPIPGELDVVETLEIENPIDRTWMGGAPDDQGRRATVAITLPKGASKPTLEFGFHGWCCTSVKDDRLIVQMPLMPGKSPFRFTYRLAATDGQAVVLTSAEAPADVVEYLIPDSINAEGRGLVKGETRVISQTLVRSYRATSLVKDATIGLSVSGLPTVVRTAAGGARKDASGPRTSKGQLPLYTAIGVGVVILGGALYLYLRPPANRPKYSTLRP